MAEMRPEHPKFNEEAKISREDVAFGLLRDNLPADAIVLYAPFVFNRRNQARNPDFIVLHPDFGVAVIEVKNWNLDNIVSVDNTCVKAKEGKLKITRDLPVMQAKNYVHDLQSHLERECATDPDIIRQSGPKKGRTAPYIGHFVVFMKTTDDDLEKIVSKFNRTMTQDDILTEESLGSPNRIMACLKAKANKTPVDAVMLRRIANAITPPHSTQTTIAEKADHTRIELLPNALYRFVNPKEGLDPFARFNALKEILRSVCTDSYNIVCADNPDGVRTKKIGRILEGIEADRFQIGLFGKTASGKSTFINSLFGEELLEPGRGETTKTLTRIMRPDGEHGDRDTVVHYKTWEDLSVEVYEQAGAFLTMAIEPGGVVLPTTNVNGVEIPDLSKAATVDALKKIVGEDIGKFQTGDIKNAAKFLKGLVTGWDASKEKMVRSISMPLTESKLLCGVEESAIYIAACDIYLDHAFITENNIVLIDSPGFGSSLRRHTRLALETARDVDAAIMLTPATDLLMEPEQRFIDELQGMRTHGKLTNLVYILNQIGRIDIGEGGKKFDSLEEAVASECDRLRKKLYDDLGITDPVIYAVDSKCALTVQLVQKGDERAKKKWEDGKTALTGNKDDLQGNLDASGFPKMLEGLSRRLQANKIVDFLGAKQSMLLGELDSFKADVQREVEAMGVELERFLEQKRLHVESRENAKKMVDEFLDFTIPGKIQKKHENLDEDIDAFVRKDILETITRHVRANYMKYAAKKLSSKNFWPSLMSDESLLYALERAIVDKRKYYHDGYSKIRDENKVILIGNVLTKSYGEKLQLDYPYEPEPISALNSISMIKNLRLSFLQDIKMVGGNVADLIARLFGKEIDLLGWLEEFLSTNFISDCKDAIKKDILDWIRKDSKHFAEASKKSFDDLMSAIEEGLEDCIKNCNDKEAERDARQKNLYHYRREIDKTVESLDELTKEVRKLSDSF